MKLSGSFTVPRLFLFVVGGELFEVFGLEYLVAIQATQVIDPVPPHQELRALVLTSGHRTQIILILMRAGTMSSPQMPRSAAKSALLHPLDRFGDPSGSLNSLLCPAKTAER